jgi:hypothetical protein
MATAFGQTIPTDGGDEDTWGLLLIALWTASYAAFQTRTENADWADYVLSRPKLGDYGEPINAIGSATGTLSHDVAATKKNHFSATLTGNIGTFTLSNPTATGNLFVSLGYITQDATGGRTITFGSAFKLVGTNTTFALSNTIANSITRLRFETIDAGTTWYVSEEVLKP